MTLSKQRKTTYPLAEDTWDSLAAREMPDTPLEDAVGMLQSWNLHVFMRPAPPEGSSRAGNTILPCDVIFLEPPAAA